MQSAILAAFNGAVSPIPATPARSLRITCTPGTRTASQLMEEYPTLSRSAAFRMVKTGWAMLNYQVREVNPCDMRTVTDSDIESYGRFAGTVYKAHFQGFGYMRNDLIQEGITRILELSGKTTDPNYLMKAAQNAMRSYLAAHQSLRFSGTFESFDECAHEFNSNYGVDPAKQFENKSFAELGTFQSREPVQDNVRTWSTMQ